MVKLAIISTHPIQYNAPLFRQLSEHEGFSIMVFYTWSQSKERVFDPGFGREREWDIPLLEGYNYTFITNTSRSPGSEHFFGIINPSLNKEVERWNPDVILVFGWSFRSHLSLMLHFKGITPIFFRGDSTVLNERSFIKKILRRVFLKFVYRHIDLAFYVGSANRDYYLAHGVPMEKLVFAGHAIDNERFQKDAEFFEVEASKWRKKLGIKAEFPVFLFAAKIIPTKEPELLLDAFTSSHMPNAHLIIVGNGPGETELKKKYAIKANVKFVDFQNQSKMPIVYRLGDVFCLPSKGETWGLAVNEAMACGRAVLVSDKVGCASDLVHPGKNGYIFKSEDFKDLCDKMKTIYDTKNQLKSMGFYAAHVIKEWNYKNIINAIEEATLTFQPKVTNKAI